MFSSPTFTPRWTSVNDLTTDHHHHHHHHHQNKIQPISTFFLQSQSTSSTCIDPQTLTLTMRPSQSLISLIEPPPSPPPPVPPRPKRFPSQTTTESTKLSSENRPLSSSRVADIIHRFESQNTATMNKNHMKVPTPRAILIRERDGQSQSCSPVSGENPIMTLPLKKKPQPINAKHYYATIASDARGGVAYRFIHAP